MNENSIPEGVTALLEGLNKSYWVDIGPATTQYQQNRSRWLTRYAQICQTMGVEYFPKDVFAKQLKLMAIGLRVVEECVPSDTVADVEITKGMVTIRWWGDLVVISAAVWGDGQVNVRGTHRCVKDGRLVLSHTTAGCIGNIMTGGSFDPQTDELVIAPENLDLLRKTVAGVGERIVQDCRKRAKKEDE